MFAHFDEESGLEQRSVGPRLRTRMERGMDTAFLQGQLSVVLERYQESMAYSGVSCS